MSQKVEVPSQQRRLNAIASWFLGPRAENVDALQNFFQLAVAAQSKGRNSYFPEDPSAITGHMQQSDEYKKYMKRLEEQATQLSDKLSKHHVPFWNPRYNAHMSVDTTLPGQIGYLMTMIYNPNNVALEASPLTTAIEAEVGLQHCHMLGINIDRNNGQPVGWGHITCDGSVANLESVWAARNLKFYPLSLVLAMDGPLHFIASTFKITTCQGEEKLLKDFTTWELLNITPDVVLDLPDRLYSQYSISPQFLTNTMNPFLVQSISKDNDKFTQRFGDEDLNRMAYIVSATKHYSWPKAAAVTGLGSDNVIDITVDDDARMCMTDLRAHLNKCLEDKRPVYAVVAIIGSTEHGACDPLKDIVDMRKEFQAKGLSFVLHADGAWGSYFHTILNGPLPKDKWTPYGETVDPNAEILPGFPYTALKPKTRESLRHLRFCESITIDPHKSGYIQYPAGGLLYRDGRMRYLVTWTSPVVFREGDAENMGVYGIEGSKPGAAPAAVFLSHNVIGLHSRGYGTLLAEGIYSCVKMYAHLITMSTPTTDYRVRTLVKPPFEIFGDDDNPDLAMVRKLLKEGFHDDKDDSTIGYTDAKQRRLVELMGSDLAINTFVVNFRVNGVVNKDIIESNDLNKRIFDRCAIVNMEQDMNTVPVILTSTVLKQEAYKQCLTNFKTRLGLEGDQDLYVLINVQASPYPMMHNYADTIMNDLKQIIEEEVEVSKMRNTITPTFHGFVLQGTDTLYGTHLPMFNMADHRYQLIITGDLPDDVMAKYVQGRKDHPGQYFTLGNVKEAILEDMVEAGEFDAVIDIGLPPDDGSHFISGFKLTNVRVVKKAQLDSKYLRTQYPSNNMPFYLYGTGVQWHIDHALLASPNIQLCSDQIIVNDDWQIISNGPWSSEGPKLDRATLLAKVSQEPEPFVLNFVDIPESAMQPFPDNQLIASKPFFFKPGATYNVCLSKPGDFDMKNPLSRGTITLSDTIFIDTDMLNESPARSHDHEKNSNSSDSVELSGSWEEYSKRVVRSHRHVPLLKKPPVRTGKKWSNLVGELAGRPHH